ncbi:hypothetical protein QZH41_009335 [Actinostola sp. cb2023]|nr:hypothetical protein QZH41_009335 [Actinostola sp. cb2023]
MQSQPIQVTRREHGTSLITACTIPKKPDKIRVVFDCSAEFAGQSLNRHLLQGPDLTNSLVGVLCRFRQEQVAFVCDIESMFHQVRVNEEFRDLLRFLWWDQGDTTKEPEEFRMRVHLFGATSSPGCANLGLKTTTDDNESELGVEPAEFLRNNFYVDDGLNSVETSNEAISIIKSSREMCQKGGFRLHKFMSNTKEVIESVAVEDRAKGIKNIDLDKEPLPLERVLGVEWCIESDTFRFRITLKDKPLTRREGVGWDDPIPDVPENTVGKMEKRTTSTRRDGDTKKRTGCKVPSLKSTKYIPVNVEEIKNAEKKIILEVQKEAFTDERTTLRSLGLKDEIGRDCARQRNKEMKKTSQLYRLDPFLDRESILRVGGRIRHAIISDEVKHPAILPRKGHATELIIRYLHNRNNHQGRGFTLNEIRSSGYWVVGCSAAVSETLKNCTTCRKLRASVQEQRMADLPADRLEPSPPFTYCGVDYFGPWYVKQGSKKGAEEVRSPVHLHVLTSYSPRGSSQPRDRLLHQRAATIHLQTWPIGAFLLID